MTVWDFVVVGVVAVIGGALGALATGWLTLRPHIRKEMARWRMNKALRRDAQEGRTLTDPTVDRSHVSKARFRGRRMQ